MSKLKKELVGRKYFEGTVNITDPCYNKDVLYRMDAEVTAGTYDCIAWIDPDEERVSIIGIYLYGIPNADTMEEIGEIDVDAGLAGFFMNKPDYTDEEWSEFCNSIREGKAWIKDEGFFSSSGWGDGCYPVYAKRDVDSKIIALEILFIGADDDDDDEY